MIRDPKIMKELGLNKSGDTRGKRLTPLPKQKLAVDLVLSGGAKNITDAARKAGYKKDSVHNIHQTITHAAGVKAYLTTLDQKSKDRFGLSIQDNVMETYLDGLKATKLYGKNAKEHPDYGVRVSTADRFARFFGWEKVGLEEGKGEYNQFNFFNVDPARQKKFHENLKGFIKKSYNKV